MQKVVEEKTHQRRSINKSNCLADYIPGLSLPRARSSPRRQKQNNYHGHCDSPLATGFYEPRKNLGWFLNQMEKPYAMVLLLYVMIMTVVDLLPSPVSYEACWFVRKYICCKNYGSNRPLVGINSPCGIYFCGQVFSPPLRLHRLYSNDELL